MASGASSLSAPPADLGGFPAFVARLPLFRMHRADRGPWWFSRDGSGRFDLEGGRGTCYLAEEPAGCFLEVFRSWTLVPEPEVTARRLSRLDEPAEILSRPLADCTSGLARSFRVTGEIHSTPDYRRTRPWAEALAAAGFAGIRYLLRHDPGQQLAGIALFGPAGAPTWTAPPPELIATSLVLEVEERFGLRVLPVP